MILSILHPEITKNIVTICNKKKLLHNVTPFFSKKFQIENQNLPIDLDPILNNLGDFKRPQIVKIKFKYTKLILYHLKIFFI
jgi:hypothetical protein